MIFPRWLCWCFVGEAVLLLVVLYPWKGAALYRYVITGFFAVFFLAGALGKLKEGE